MSEPDEDGMRELARKDVLGRMTVREQVLDILLEKIDNDHYPSPSMLDDVERLMTPWRREDYAEVLLAKVRQDRFPSRAMVERLVRLSE